MGEISIGRPIRHSEAREGGLWVFLLPRTKQEHCFGRGTVLRPGRSLRRPRRRGSENPAPQGERKKRGAERGPLFFSIVSNVISFFRKIPHLKRRQSFQRRDQLIKDPKLTSAEKKARYRKKMRLDGYTEVSVWVAPGQVEAVRNFADSLPKPSKPSAKGQGSLLDLMGSTNA